MVTHLGSDAKQLLLGIAAATATTAATTLALDRHCFNVFVRIGFLAVEVGMLALDVDVVVLVTDLYGLEAAFDRVRRLDLRKSQVPIGGLEVHLC